MFNLIVYFYNIFDTTGAPPITYADIGETTTTRLATVPHAWATRVSARRRRPRGLCRDDLCDQVPGISIAAQLVTLRATPTYRDVTDAHGVRGWPVGWVAFAVARVRVVGGRVCGRAGARVAGLETIAGFSTHGRRFFHFSSIQKPTAAGSAHCVSVARAVHTHVRSPPSHSSFPEARSSSTGRFTEFANTA